MKLVPTSVTRFGHRSLLKLNASSPTILVVAGTAGLVGTAVMAARASRRLDPIIEEHRLARASVEQVSVGNEKKRSRQILAVYTDTASQLTRLYGPTIVVGSVSVVSVLSGHNIIRQRHIATMAAYSGLMDQFNAYRGRIARTLGEDVERGIYEGAHGEWEETENKGEYKLQPKFDKADQDTNFARPWFDETNVHWSRDPQQSYMLLKGVQSHMNQLLEIRGHVFLNDVFDALRIPRIPEGQVVGWLRSDKGGMDGYVDFGFMHSIDPQTVAFLNGAERTFRFNFNVDGPIYNKI